MSTIDLIYKFVSFLYKYRSENGVLFKPGDAGCGAVHGWRVLRSRVKPAAGAAPGDGVPARGAGQSLLVGLVGRAELWHGSRCVVSHAEPGVLGALINGF